MGKERENLKNPVDDYKTVIGNFCRENFFPQTSHSEILGPPRKFSVPQTRRQVSATAFHEEGLNYVALLFPASQPRLKCCVDLDHSDLDIDYQKRVYDSTMIQITCCAHC